MSETTEQTTTTRSRRGGGEGLSGMVLADLKSMAAGLGLKGTSTLRKGDLIAAIQAHQTTGKSANGSSSRRSAPAEAAALPLDLPDSAVAERTPRRRATRGSGAPETAPQAEATAPVQESAPQQSAPQQSAPQQSTERTGAQARAAEAVAEVRSERERPERSERERPQSGESAESSSEGGEGQSRPDQQRGDGEEGGRNRRNRRNRRDRGDRADRTGEDGDRPAAGQSDRQQGDRPQNDRPQNDRPQNDRQQGGQNQPNRQQRDFDDNEDGQGRRGRRYRDRDRNRRGGRADRFSMDVPDTEVREDDVLLPVAGIVDVQDSYAFVRTSGYLAGPNDVYVSLSQVRKYGLRRGDAVTGAVRAPRDGEQGRQKFNALVRLDTVNGLDPERAKQRPEFTKLTPLYPNERLRLETESHILTTRVIDLVMPVGKGQRALIVSPPKAGKTSVLQAIANAIATNNPECHLMVVLVDERPEEVTDMQRSVKGEVIASTFDRPPADHTMVAELSIERAKRLVEMGKDVVVLLDSITRLGRAYNLAAPASGRILSGGVDSTALFPPKRFLGAARNIENGGSLTIFASALVETGSAGDTVIFEEFKGTGNAELKLDRRLADKRIFPAIDVDQSSTRKEDLLLSPDELAIVVKLRRLLSALEAQPALDLVLTQLRKTRNNVEFLMNIAKNAPASERD